MSGIEEAAHPTVAGWPEERLVKECLAGNQEAWAVLIQRYKNLIYSIPLKYGFSREDSSDVFQQVCLQLLDSLSDLREPKCLTNWLIKLTSHTCFRWSKQNSYVAMPDSGPQVADPSSYSYSWQVRSGELEHEQTMREALGLIPSRCRELIRMLFYEEPALPYEEVARELGLAKGSIGFVRMRCLRRLRKVLQENSF